MAGGDKRGDFHRTRAQRDLDDAAGFDFQLTGHRRRNVRRIVPGELGHGLRRFLHPGIVGESAVADITGQKHHFKAWEGGGGDFRNRFGIHRHFHFGEQTAGNHPVVQRLAPNAIGIGGRQRRLPVVLHHRVALFDMAVGELRGDFNGRAPVVERSDLGLQDGGGAIGGAGVAPSLHRVGERQMPLGGRGGFIHIGPQIDRGGHLRNGSGEVEVDRGRVGRIAAQDYQRIHLAGGNLLSQFPNALGRLEDRFRESNRRADIAERLVHQVSQGVNLRALHGAGGDDRLAGVGL